jgi:predicted ArsR family transcriptional regulator
MSATSNNTTDKRVVSDRSVVEYLRRRGSCTISDLVNFAGVTATAIRQRLNRLMEQGLIVRQAEPAGRGRPTHRYSLSPTGLRCGGNNYEDLATVLWAELRAVQQPEVRHRLLQRLMERLAEVYRNKVSGATVDERMAALAELMHQRDIPFEVQSSNGDHQLPVLQALACPYPDLAEQDRGICSLEKMLFSEILGEGLRLSACRLDGANGCTFELSAASTASA